eukprot:31232-Pelagococcus_subviridis.AAC.16
MPRSLERARSRRLGELGGGRRRRVVRGGVVRRLQLPLLHGVVIEQHRDDGADARATAARSRREREPPGLRLRAHDRRELELVRGDVFVFVRVVVAAAAVATLLALALRLPLAPLRHLRVVSHAVHLHRATDGLDAEEFAVVVESHERRARLVRARFVPIRGRGLGLGLGGDEVGVLVGVRALRSRRAFSAGDGEEVEPVVRGPDREPRASRVHVQRPRLRAQRGDRLRAVLRVEIPHAHGRVFAARHEPPPRGGRASCVGIIVAVDETRVRDLPLVPSEAAQTRLRDDVPHDDVRVLPAGHEQGAVARKPQRGDLALVPFQEDVRAAVHEIPQADRSVARARGDDVAPRRARDARHRGKRAALARRRDERAREDAASDVPHRETLERGADEILTAGVVHGSAVRGRNDAERARLLVAKVRLHHDARTRGLMRRKRAGAFRSRARRVSVARDACGGRSSARIAEKAAAAARARRLRPSDDDE